MYIQYYIFISNIMFGRLWEVKVYVWEVKVYVWEALGSINISYSSILGHNKAI